MVIINRQMEFIYSAFNNSQAVPVKGKISRWRHLESICSQLIVIGLVFFLILQNGSLRRQISSKLSHQVVEDILNQKIVQLVKEIEETKSLILETSKKDFTHAEELKKIIKILIREIGLPLPNAELELHTPASLTQVLPVEQSQHHFKTKEKLRLYQENDFQNKRFEEDSEEEQLSEEQNQQNEIEFQQLNNHKQQDKCSYLQYIYTALSDQNSAQMERHQDELQKDENPEILAFYKEKESQSTISFSNYLSQINSVLMIGGNLLLILLFFLCLFILGSFVKNPKYRSKSGEAFENMLKGAPKVDQQSGPPHIKQQKVIKI